MKDASLKAKPSLSGVVIDTHLYSRAVKTKNSCVTTREVKKRLTEEEEVEKNELLDIMIDKLATLTAKKVSQGVTDTQGIVVLSKGAKFTKTALRQLELHEEMCIRDRLRSLARDAARRWEEMVGR